MAQDAETLVSEEKTLSVFQLIMDGGLGAQIIIAVLFVLLFTAVYIYFERLFAIKAASRLDRNFMNQIRDNVAQGNIQAAKMLCVQQDSPVSRLTEKGISRIGSPLEDINTAIENAGKLEIYKLEKNVAVLATIAGAAPMIGFLGTVIGMILAFQSIELAGEVEATLVAGGIKVALLTTAAGLVIAIPVSIAHNFFVSRIDAIVIDMEESAQKMVDTLHGMGTAA